MIPTLQSRTGPRGNCMSACIASLLELPIEAVPDFLMEPGDTSIFDWSARLDQFLEPHGLYALHFSTRDPRAVFPGCLHVITGISPRGRPHACVGQGRRVVWDPHPDQSGLESIDGFIVIAARL